MADPVFLLMVTGAVSGLLIGLSGVGGAALTTPALIVLAGLAPAEAIATDLAYVTLVKGAATARHARLHNIDWRLVGWLGCGSIPATFLVTLGFATASHGGDHVRLPLLGVALLVSAVALLLRKHAPRDASPAPSSRGRLIGIGAGVGALVAATSIGAGSLALGLLVIATATPLRRLVGSDVAHAAMLSGVTALLYLQLGFLQWSYVLWLSLGALPATWLGASLLPRIDETYLKRGLALLLALIGVRLLA